MKKYFLLSYIMLFSFVSILNAQDYQPFKTRYTYQYSYKATENNSLGIHTVKVDSSKVLAGDSIFFFNPIAMVVLGTNNDNMWGKEMIKKTDSVFLFTFSNSTDSLVLKTNLIPGAQWTFKINDSIYTATYLHKRNELVANTIMDSVKTFLIQSTFGFTDSIKISKSNGIVYSFPFVYLTSPTDKTIIAFFFKGFKLEYIHNTSVGINRLNYFNYFTFNEGDVFVYSPQALDSGPPSYLNNDVVKIINKKISSKGDTIWYVVNKCHIVNVFSGGYSTLQSLDSMTVTANSVLISAAGWLPLVNLLTFPMNNFANKTNTLGYYYFYVDTVKIELHISYPLVHFENFTDGYFFKNVGLQSYTINDLVPSYQYVLVENLNQNILNTDCNLDYILATTTPLTQASSALIISPNPFQDHIVLQSKQLIQGKYTIRILSMLGSEVYKTEQSFDSSDSQIILSDLSSIASGMYILSVEGQQQQFRYSVVKQ